MDDDTTRETVEAQIRARVLQDPELRSRLVADPTGTLFEMAGAEPVEGLNVRVIEEEPGEVVLVIPSEPASRALSEKETEAVSAGSMINIFKSIEGL